MVVLLFMASAAEAQIFVSCSGRARSCVLKESVQREADKLSFPEGWSFVLVSDADWTENAVMYHVSPDVRVFTHLAAKRTFLHESRFIPLRTDELRNAILHERQHLQLSLTHHTSDKELKRLNFGPGLCPAGAFLGECVETNGGLDGRSTNTSR